MIERLKNRLLKRSKIQKLLGQTCENLTEIRKNSHSVALYGSPTHGHWLGIANATKGLYEHTALEIPQVFSNPVFSEKDIITLCQKIKDLKFEKVTISGFAFYFFGIIDHLYDSCQIETIFHGTISEFHEPSTQKIIKTLIQYGKEKKIHKMLFVKKGLEKVFQDFYGFDAAHQPLNPPLIPQQIDLIKTDPTKTHIGVFGVDTFNKNLHNQVIYALMNPNTVVHVLDKKLFGYLGLDDRIVEHGKNLPKEKFFSILGAMDLNLYMSYSESWGLVAYESEAMGVPAVRMDDVDYFTKIKIALEAKKPV